MRIGLLGGSFNPPHEGHKHISLIALKRLKLDRLWWIVSPGNPLKSHNDLASLNERIHKSKVCSNHPKIDVTGFEETRRSPYTYKTLRYLTQRYPGTCFIWIMGADNLRGFHHWQHWQQLIHLMPIVIIDRPTYRYRALSSRAAHYMRAYYRREVDQHILNAYEGPAWTFLTDRLCPISSTEIRQNLLKNAQDH